MSAYIHGSLALEERDTQANDRTVAKQSRKVYRTKPVPGTEKLLWIFGALICCAIAGIYQFREAANYELNSQIVQMETEIRQLEEQNAKLRNKIAELQSPERLIESGIQLGLVQQHNAVPAVGQEGMAVAITGED